MGVLSSLRGALRRRSVWILLASTAAVSGVAFLVPSTGRILVSVSGRAGVPVRHVRLFIDRVPVQCPHLPCLVAEQRRGVHELEVLAEDFAPAKRQWVEVRARQQALASFSLDPLPSLGLKVGGTQPDVVLSVDGREIGPLPQEVHGLAIGSHKISVTGGDSYRPLERSVELEPGKLTDAGIVQLRVLVGRLTILPGPLAADRVRLIHDREGYELRELPTTRAVNAGAEWVIHASKKGFLDYSANVGFEDGVRDKTYTVTFARPHEFAIAPPVRWSTPRLLDGEQIRATFARYAPSVKRACWHPALHTSDADASPIARVQAAITIAPNGTVKDVITAGDPRGYHGLAECIARRLKGWQFPIADEATTVNIPFVYTAE